MTTALLWLVERTGGGLRLGRFLHVTDTVTRDGDRVASDTMVWSPDPTRALRFAAKRDAERFGANRLLSDFRAVPFPAADLVVEAGEDDEDEPPAGGQRAALVH